MTYGKGFNAKIPHLFDLKKQNKKTCITKALPHSNSLILTGDLLTTAAA